MTDPQVRRLARQINALEKQVRALSASPRLSWSSIEDGAVDEFDGDGNLVGRFGEQFDGTHTVASFNGPPPPAPVAPVAVGQVGAITVSWSGEWVGGAVAPMDLARIDVHVVNQPTDNPMLARPVASIVNQGWGGASASLDSGEYYAVLVAWSQSGKYSVSGVSNVAVVSDPESGSDGIPPSESPKPEVTGGVGFLTVRVPEISNPDPVQVRVYVDTSTPVDTDGDVGGVTANGGAVIVSRTVSGGTVEPGTTYYVATVAFDVDGDGPVSDEATGSPVRVDYSGIAQEIVDDITGADSKAQAAQAAAQDAVDAAADAAEAVAGKSNVLVQPNAPAAEFETDTTLWIDTSAGGKNKPKAWDGSGWVVVDDADIQQAAQDAADAQAAADAAAQAATQAQQAAEGKSTIFYGPTSPTGANPANPVDGDVFFVRDGNLATVEQWRYVGGAWEQEKIDGAVLANLDAGTITAGFLDVASLVRAGAILADKLAVGGGNELVEDPEFEHMGTTWVVSQGDPADWSVGPVSGRPGNSLTYEGVGSGSVQFRGSRSLPARVGDSYVFTVDASSVDGSSFLIYTFLMRGASPVASLGFESFAVGTDWTELELRFTVADGPGYTVQSGDHIAIAFLMNSAGKPSFNSPSLKQLVGGTLIEDGAIATEKLAAGAVTVNELTVNEALVKSLVAEMMTSRTFRTAESGQRVEINSTDGLVGYDASETKATQVGTDGQLVAVGATLKSTGSSERVEFTSSGFRGFSGPWNVRENYTHRGFMSAIAAEDRLQDGLTWFTFVEFSPVDQENLIGIAYYNPNNSDDRYGWLLSGGSPDSGPLDMTVNPNDPNDLWLAMNASDSQPGYIQQFTRDGYDLLIGDAHAIDLPYGLHHKGNRIIVGDWAPDHFTVREFTPSSGNTTVLANISGTWSPDSFYVDNDDRLWLLELDLEAETYQGLASEMHMFEYPYTGSGTVFSTPNGYLNQGVSQLPDGRVLTISGTPNDDAELYEIDTASGQFDLIKYFPAASDITLGLLEPAGYTVWVGRSWYGGSYAQHIVEDGFIATEVNTTEARIDVSSVNSSASVSSPVVYTDRLMPFPGSTGVVMAGIVWPQAPDDAASKEYVDGKSDSFAALLTGSFSIGSGNYNSSTKITNFTADSWTNMPLTNRFVDYSNGDFTVKIAATFLINFVIRWGGSSKGKRYMMICKNGVQAYMWTANPPGSESYNTEMFRPFYLEQGDVLSFEVAQTSGSSMSITGGTRPWHSGIQIGVV